MQSLHSRITLGSLGSPERAGLRPKAVESKCCPLAPTPRGAAWALGGSSVGFHQACLALGFLASLAHCGATQALSGGILLEGGEGGLVVVREGRIVCAGCSEIASGASVVCRGQ